MPKSQKRKSSKDKSFRKKDKQHKVDTYTREKAIIELRGGPRNESQLQCQIFKIIRFKELEDWKWKQVYSVPNQGSKSKAHSARLKGEGMRPGQPDINVDLPITIENRFYPGLRIELKMPRGQLRQTQRERITIGNACGYVSIMLRTSDPWEVVNLIETWISKCCVNCEEPSQYIVPTDLSVVGL